MGNSTIYDRDRNIGVLYMKLVEWAAALVIISICYLAYPEVTQIINSITNP